MKKETIYLVHGLYMHGMVMSFMRLKFEKLGYDVKVFSYASVQSSLACNAEKLARFIADDTEAGRVCHFVGHSLGGLLIRQTYEIVPDVFTGKIVTLGTPHNGSFVARRVAKNIHQAIIGGAYDNALDGELPPWKGDVPLGSLAGRLSIGLGVIYDLPKPNDGMVIVEETQLPYQTDTITLPINHTALVYSSRVVEQVHYFLQNTVFLHEREEVATNDGT